MLCNAESLYMIPFQLMLLMSRMTDFLCILGKEQEFH